MTTIRTALKECNLTMKTLLLNPRTQSFLLTASLILINASFTAFASSVVSVCGAVTSSSRAPQTAGTPSDVVREFYRLMRERKFREAFALTIYAPAIAPLSTQEYEDLKPEFELRAADAPEKVELTGEQVSGNEATVFMKLGSEADRNVKVIPIFLIREKSGPWLIGEREDQKIVKKQGKRFFFEARILAHEDVVEEMMKRISTAQLLHAAQNGGAFGDLKALVRMGLIPQDILSHESTGYRFRVTPDGKGWSAGAEPARYGHTGRLSFYIDNTSALKKEDKGGKPLKGS